MSLKVALPAQYFKEARIIQYLVAKCSGIPASFPIPSNLSVMYGTKKLEIEKKFAYIGDIIALMLPKTAAY